VAALILLALVAAATWGGFAAASGNHRTEDLRNARYCEVFELRGAIPDAEVVVFNTIGLNNCPAARWHAIDPAKLARRLGATAVILNGPRHFLMDSAAGHLGKPRTIAGIRMRRAASIPIRSAADLVQAPYTERTIERHNTWRWDGGRRIYELLAPNGARYVMQSYAQIRDRHMSVGHLRRLGRRLDLPAGWRFRTWRLAHELVLRARGSATIVQDDLLDTYQRLP
jgi:hypothetical protein